jgi:hypothetical protein
MLQGLVLFEPVTGSPAGEPEPFVESIWHEPYEAEQHLHAPRTSRGAAPRAIRSAARPWHRRR